MFYLSLSIVELIHFRIIYEKNVTGGFVPVSGTVFDLRLPTKLSDVIHKVPNSPGYDHNFCITKGSQQKYTFVAKVLHPGMFLWLMEKIDQDVCIFVKNISKLSKFEAKPINVVIVEIFPITVVVI